jgi:hypothetical protein
MATAKELRQQVARDLDQPLVEGDVPRSGVFWTRHEVNQWLNEAYRHIYAKLAEIEAPWLVTEATGTYTSGSRFMAIRDADPDDTTGGLLSIDHDPLKIAGIFDITGDSTEYGTRIRYMPYNQFEAYRSSVSRQGGTPPANVAGWTWWGHEPMNISLYPLPSGNIELRIRFVPGTPTVLVRSNFGEDDVFRGGRFLSDLAISDGAEPVSIPANFHDILPAYAVVKAKQKEESDYRDHQRRYEELLAQLLQSAEERQVESSRSVFVSDSSDYGHVDSW